MRCTFKNISQGKNMNIDEKLKRELIEPMVAWEKEIAEFSD